MNKIIATSIAFPLLIFCASTKAGDKTSCPLIQAWGDVPAPVRSALAGRVGRIAEKGEQFNATDVVSSDLANNRFLTGCQTAGLVSVALERGGRGFRIEVFQFKSGKFLRSWIQRLDSSSSVTVELLQPPAVR